jgi:HD-GYP domain-containing protein (c-di-GMP phosphodiesterase class II)
MTTAVESSRPDVLGTKADLSLLNSFFIVYKTSRIIEEANKTYQNQIADFYKQLMERSTDTDSLTIKVVHNRYFVNEKMVPFNDQGPSGASTVIDEWRMLGIGGVTFLGNIGKEETSRFFRFISSSRPNIDHLESLAEKLKSHGFDNVTLLGLKELNASGSMVSEEVRRQFRKAARNSFFQAMSVVKEAVVNTADDREINVAKTKRVVHTLIDQITRDESSLIELTAIRDFDDYTYAHSTNVCVYALTMGIRLGLDRARLSQLGLTALFHDIGKVKLPKDIITKPDAFDENDWIQMQRHPLLGAKTILRNLKLDAHNVRAAVGAFEHHINQDFTGYPLLRHKKRPTNLFSKIIAIVDSFDALSSGRIYLKKSIPPDEVVKKMRYQMKIKFDPFLLKLFNNIIGIYPAGSLVLLTTDEIALILTNNDIDRARPYVKIVGNRSGLLDKPIWVDLSQEGQEHRKLTRMLDPSRYGLDVKDFVLQD